MNSNQNDPYNVNNYSDEELYKILDINNPSDRELEARINSLIFKYSNMDNDSGNKLADFFSDIYIINKKKCPHNKYELANRVLRWLLSENSKKYIINLKNKNQQLFFIK